MHRAAALALETSGEWRRMPLRCASAAAISGNDSSLCRTIGYRPLSLDAREPIASIDQLHVLGLLGAVCRREKEGTASHCLLLSTSMVKVFALDQY